MYTKFRQQIWAVRQGINPRDKNQKQANFCSQVQYKGPMANPRFALNSFSAHARDSQLVLSVLAHF